MFTEKQLDRYADVLIWGLTRARTGKFKKGDIISVRFNLSALSLAEILQEKILDMGMHPVVRMLSTPAMEGAFFGKGNDSQLVFEPPGERAFCRKLNGSIYLNAPESLTHLQKVNPSNIAKTAIARKPIRDILMKREEKGEFGWTLCSLTTPQLAKHAKLSLKEYTAQIVKACYLDKKDAAAKWEETFNNAIEIKRWLNGLKIKEYHVESKNIDLKVAHGEKRRWIGISGHNLPSFELFISPDWRGTEGIFYANQPSYRSGNYVTGVRLEFKKGVAVKIDAEKGKSFTRQQLGMDAGAKKLGEFSLTDKRFSKIDKFMADTLFDENFGGKFGNCHVAVGSSYSDTFKGDLSALTAKTKKELGFNDSALHWDLVNTEEKRVSAVLNNGKKILIYEKGMFNY